MRLYVSILTVAGLSMSACGKKAEVKPEPAKTQEPAKTEEPAKVEAPKDPAAEAPTDPAAEAPKDPVAEAPKDPTPAPVADRTEGVQKALEALTNGDIDAAYGAYADDVVYYNVGNPQMAEIKGKAVLVDMMKAMKASTTELKVKASRIIEAGDVQVVEYVIHGQFKVPGDDAAATKSATIPAAMVLAYNAEGKITTAWNFQDDASLLQQIGMVPLDADFKTVAFPETTEIVKGEKNDALAAIYKDFSAKMMNPETVGAAIELLAEDYTTVDFATGKTLAKADMAEVLKGVSSMFGDMTNTIDKEFSVGEFYINVSTMTAIYKGGIGDIAAADQKLTVNSLDISRIVDGKIKSWTSYTNNMQILAGLGALGGAAEKPAEGEAAAGGEIGVAQCDNYLKTVRECMSKLPEAAQAQFETGIKSALDSWKQLAAGGEEAKTALAAACKQAIDASKQAMASMCPDVKWE